MKYTTEQIKTLVESEEPIFIIRAKDRFALPMIRFYAELGHLVKHGPENLDWLLDIDAVVAEFIEWQNQHPELVRIPD